jgi:molecular chaperone GrpE
MGDTPDDPEEGSPPVPAEAPIPSEPGAEETLHVVADEGPEPSGHVPDTVDEALAEAEAAVVSDIASMVSDMDSLKRERDDYLDALRRLQADFENFRKRTMKQQTDILERAAQTLVEKLLPVLDAADLAIAHGADAAVGQVAGLLFDTLVKEGLEGVDPKPGDPFDPTLHEAVAHEPGEGGDPEVADLLRAGYRWKGALLRPAMVKVRG